jgi:hypothetical protein
MPPGIRVSVGLAAKAARESGSPVKVFPEPPGRQYALAGQRFTRP